MDVYVGYDARESLAYRACLASIKNYTGGFAVQPVNSRLLGSLYQRPTQLRGTRLWDVISDAPMATEFSLARFWVPYLQREGWALYCDCDFMFRAPLQRLFDFADSRYAVMVVKHGRHVRFDHGVKMDGQVQSDYSRKNWSSLVLWNCSHPLNRKLNLDTLNSAPGLWLHQFGWLEDAMGSDVIGELPLDWNWLAGISEHVDNPQAVHFTLGTPDMRGYELAYGHYGDEWRGYASR